MSKWHDNGLRTIEAAKKFCEEEKKQNMKKAARKNTVSGAKWKTGAEAGIDIQAEETVSESSEKKATIDEKNEGIPSDILDLFGETDEEIDDSVDI